MRNRCFNLHNFILFCSVVSGFHCIESLYSQESENRENSRLQATPVQTIIAKPVVVDPVKTSEKQPRLINRIFAKKRVQKNAAVVATTSNSTQSVAVTTKKETKGIKWPRFSRTDRKSDSVARIIESEIDFGASALRENDSFDRFPHQTGYNTKKSKSQKEIEDLIDRIYATYDDRIDSMNPPDLNKKSLQEVGSVPNGFRTLWRIRVQKTVWNQQSNYQSIEAIYAKTLAHSNQVKVFRDIPLIRETALQEADGDFDLTLFGDARSTNRNEPIGSRLTTGGTGRFLEDSEYFEAGFKKKFFTGAEASLSNRWSTLENNSQFLAPQNQGESALVLSIVQPLLSGGGYHYNHAKIKIAKLDANLASSEFVSQLQSHLLEVNRAYWSLYFARSSYLLKRELVTATGKIVKQLEARADFDALESEILRARASFAQRKSEIIRAEMSIRNNEERLRAMINDPNFDIGSNAETIPTTSPVIARYTTGVKSVAREALHNRPEIQQGFDQLRTAIIRRNIQRNEKKPALNLVAETMLGDIQQNEAVGSAFEDQFGTGQGFVLGFSFEQTLDNDENRARLLRSEIELRQQANQLKSTIDTVLLEAVVVYRELMTAYREMQGRFETLSASREELRQLGERLEVDGDAEGRTTSYQLQLILDSMDRRQNAEEMFLNSVVTYNASFAGLERAKGTFLRHQDVRINRSRESDDTHPDVEYETLQLKKLTGDDSSKKSKHSQKSGGADSKGLKTSGNIDRYDPAPMVPTYFSP